MTCRHPKAERKTELAYDRETCGKCGKVRYRYHQVGGTVTWGRWRLPKSSPPKFSHSDGMLTCAS